jgi:hypothetical protein
MSATGVICDVVGLDWAVFALCRAAFALCRDCICPVSGLGSSVAAQRSSLRGHCDSEANDRIRRTEKPPG